MEEKSKSLFDYVHDHWIITTIILTCVIGVVIALTQITTGEIASGFFMGAFLGFPVALLIMELMFLIFECSGKSVRFSGLLDVTVLALGTIYEYFYLAFMKNITDKDWPVQLSNAETHTPVFTQAMPTVAAIFLVGIAGYFILKYISLEKMPPLVAVLSMSALYLGVIQLIVFTFQVLNIENFDLLDPFLFVLPACCVLIAVRTILEKIHQWQHITMEKSKIQDSPVLSSFDSILNNAALWPVFALILAIPLLGILIGILVLFGQAPDAIVKAWTETSDWTLSQQISPPNVQYDEHYLCTVAAGGHRKVVKPIRKGVRHGHEVTVNRQLCVANAFEQILEDYTPHFHKAVRGFYDKYGFPIARLIKKQWIADIVYFIMKPLEWLFVVVLYLVDVHPENRIAVQYMGKVPAYRH